MQGVAAFPPLLVCAITQLTMANRSVTVLETKMGGGVFRRLLHPTVRIPVIYLAVAVPWVFLTDVLVRWAAPSDGVEAAVASGKGVGFVVVTTLFLYAGIRQSFQTITRAQHDAEASERRFRAATEGDIAAVVLPIEQSAYAAPWRVPTLPAMDAMLMMRPWPRLIMPATAYLLSK